MKLSGTSLKKNARSNVALMRQGGASHQTDATVTPWERQVAARNLAPRNMEAVYFVRRHFEIEVDSDSSLLLASYGDWQYLGQLAEIYLVMEQKRHTTRKPENVFRAFLRWLELAY